MTEIKFNSNREFFEFVDHLSADLNELGFSHAGQQLHIILHEMAWTTSSEVFGEIKVTLQELKAGEGDKLPLCLTKDVDLCINTIEEAGKKANR